MYVGKKYRIQPRSFRHRIRENFGQFYDDNHLMGLDPFDHTLFPGNYEPPAKVREKDESYTIELMIPGFKKEEVDINVVGDCLVVKGNKESDLMEESQEYIHHEHVVNGFRREFFLNPVTDRDNVEASFDHGMLKITLHKLPDKVEKKEVVIG